MPRGLRTTLFVSPFLVALFATAGCFHQVVHTGSYARSGQRDHHEDGGALFLWPCRG